MIFVLVEAVHISVFCLGQRRTNFLEGRSSALHFMASKLSSFIEVRIIWPYSIDQDRFRSVQVVGSQLFY